jgi:hypothetical protein
LGVKEMERIEGLIYSYTAEEVKQGIMLYDVLLRTGLYTDLKKAKGRISRGTIGLIRMKEPIAPVKEIFDEVVLSNNYRILAPMFALGFVCVRLCKKKYVFLEVSDA